MQKTKKTLIIILFALALQPLPAQERADTACVFRFPSGIRMFKTGYGENRRSLQFLRERLHAFRKGQDTLYVNGYSGSGGTEQSNRRMAYWRSINLKGYLINTGGLRERDFKTENHPFAHPVWGEAVTIGFSPSGGITALMDSTGAVTATADTTSVFPAHAQDTARQEVRETVLLPERTDKAEAEMLPPDGEASVQPQTDSTVIPVAPVEATPDARAGWYAGIQAGLPFGVSAYSSFGEDKTRAGWSTGIYGGYRFNPVFSLEAQAAWGQFNLSSRGCCPDYWLGSDGHIYEGAAAGMTGWDWHSLKNRVFMQRYGVQFNVNVLGFFTATQGGRWSLEISPQLNATGTKATFRIIADNAEAMKGVPRWHFGAGGNVQAGYRLTEHLLLGIYTGLVWYSGDPIDGTPKYLHKANYVWESGVRIGWHFGSNGKEAKR